LRTAGIRIDIIGAKAGQTIGGKRGKVKASNVRGVDDVHVEDYDALFIPGGYSPDELRADRRFIELVREFDSRGKLIAAVCHGPQLLLSADLVRGRTLTAWPTVQTDLVHAGANVIDQEVVIDGNWITSRKPDDLEAFSQAILGYLGEGAGVHAH
jgi:protease I